MSSLVASLEQDGAMPTSQAIATAAGVTQRTLFRHFDSVDDIVAAVITRQRAVYLAHLAVPPADATADERGRLLAERRHQLFVTVAPVRRVAVGLRDRHPAIDDGLTAADAALRTQVADTFVAELAASGERREVVLDALDQAVSWEAWERLSGGLGRRGSRVVDVMALGLGAALSGG